MKWLEWLDDPSIGTWLIEKPGASLVVLIIALLVRWVSHRFIDSIARRAEKGAVPSVLADTRAGALLADLTPSAVSERRRQRALAMASLLKSIVTCAVMGVAVVTILSIFGIPVAPLLTSAGIAGVALGFGAQTLVKDFLAGIFMIMEDQYGVGDAVDLGEATGIVEAVGLRVTRVRDVNGTVWYVRNGEVVRVGNMSQNWARAVLDITVSSGQDLDHIQTLLREESHALCEDPAFADVVLEEPEVWGVERIDVSGVLLRLVLKTAPMHQADVARDLRARIMRRFTQEHIAIPTAQWPPTMGKSTT